MIGLLVLVGLLLYVVVSLLVVNAVRRYARDNGKSTKRWGWCAVLVLFLIPFWDWLPTVAVHHYYCATEAGFRVYKTVDQWKAENPNVIETLVMNDPTMVISHSGDENSWTTVERLNQRIDVLSRRDGPLFLYRWRMEGAWIDSKTNEVLARYVDFYTSYERRQAGWRGWKFWLATDHCRNYQDRGAAFSKFIEDFKGTKK